MHGLKGKYLNVYDGQKSDISHLRNRSCNRLFLHAEQSEETGDLQTEKEMQMLSEQRYLMILELLEKNRSITVAELAGTLNISESTARRDLKALDRAGRLTKVFGGAVVSEGIFSAKEPTVAQKSGIYRNEKMKIAKYAASLIGEDDFIFLDAGTTTGCMLEFIGETGASFVTNAVSHARKLAANGIHVLLTGGELKGSTEAVVGTTAVLSLRDYHFTMGFFGVNGISKTAGLTTPDMNEALVKKTAMEQCRESVVVCDHSKFGMVSSVTFASLEDVLVLTDEIPAEYRDIRNVILCTNKNGSV